MDLINASKFMSLLLRHKPELIGLVLDENGWANIDELTQKTLLMTTPLSKELILQVVETSDRSRFAINEKRDKVRANQGHSISVDLGLEIKEPPAILYHGTSTRFLEFILSIGLTKQKRHHVHLSDNIHTARKVGVRYGKLVVLHVDAKAMLRDGYTFYCSRNEVWLTDHVPANYLSQTMVPQ